MKLVIFGVTGTIGRQLVDQAHSQGHRVTAFARSPEKFGRTNENLRVAQGDVLDPASVKSAVQGQDGALCALGMPMVNKENLRANGTKNIIRAMQETGVNRFVCLSALGAGDSRDILPIHFKHLIIPLVMRHLYADHELQESYAKDSRLDWVIVRPGSFSNGKYTGAYRHGFTAVDRSLKLKVSAADVADFMLKQLIDDTYLRQTPSLSY